MSSQHSAVTSLPPASDFSSSDEPAAKKHKTEAAAVASHLLDSPIPPAPQFHLDSSAHRSPLLFDSDLSATPVHLSSANGSDLFASPASQPASVAPAALESAVQHLTHSEPVASSSASMSAHSSKSNSRAHSPVSDKDQQPMQSGGTAAAAQPAAKPNNTAKSTDPAGGTISEAELEGRFKVIRYLGKGSYGTVRRHTHTDTHKLCCSGHAKSVCSVH